jgi:hypothetical protein
MSAAKARRPSEAVQDLIKRNAKRLKTTPSSASAIKPISPHSEGLRQKAVKKLAEALSAALEGEEKKGFDEVRTTRGGLRTTESAALSASPGHPADSLRVRLRLCRWPSR